MNGQKEIADMMEVYRNNPPKTINGSEVVQLLDYEMRKGKDLKSGNQWDISLPKSNVLQFILADGSKISARPSGTEPKIKFYFSVNTTIRSAAEFDSVQVHGELDKKIQGIISDMGLK